MSEIDDIEIEDLFKMPIQDRKKLIEMGSIFLLQQVGVMELLTGNNFQTSLNITMDNLDKKVENAKNTEQYELCYYLEEVKWETIKKLKK